MPTNLRHAATAILVVGLLLTASLASCVSSNRPIPGETPTSTQSVLLVSPTIIEFSLATRTPAGFDPAPTLFMVPSTTSTPETLTLALDVASTATSSDVNNQIIEPFETGQPDEDRTPTRLVIPAIGLDAPVEPVGWHTETRDRQPVNVWDVPDYFAAGWLKTSAPVGMPGNTVLDGHHNIRGRVFENLVDLEVGDLITLYTASQERVYRVEQKLILKDYGQSIEIRQANAQYIHPTADERLTLVTCWPPTGNVYRLIIIARPVSLSSSAPSIIVK
ncbi:MAG: sortase [Anaerolineales bacterium]|nr:sortase [Anaerolineales bacterium]